MQGEGQEFESPRLHHLPGVRRNRTDRVHPRNDPNHRDKTRNELLIRDLPVRAEVTDQRIAGRRSGASRPVRGSRKSEPHLNNWICFGRLKIFDFAE